LGSLVFLKDFGQETDITRFLPDNSDTRSLHLSALFKGTDISRSMILDITPDVSVPASDAVAFSDHFAESLNETGLFRSIQNGKLDADIQGQYYKYYFPNRYNMASSIPENSLPEILCEKGLALAASDLRRKLISPLSAYYKNLASHDPLLLFPRRLEAIQEMGAAIQPTQTNGRFTSPDGRSFLILAQTHTDTFDTIEQRRIIDTIQERFTRQNGAFEQKFALDYTGVNRFSLAAERLIKRDINQAFILSSLGIIIIFLAFFRRVRILLITFSPAIAGLLFALGISTAVLGKLHGITIAFGATLIGICIDYPIHLLNHCRLSNTWSGKLPKDLRNSLVMSCLTTLIGFAALGFSSFPGIRQIAFFAFSGILFAFVFTLLIFPGLAQWAVGNAGGRVDMIAGGVTRIRIGISMRRKTVLIAVAILCCAALIPLKDLEVKTDVRALNSTDPETVQVDQAIRNKLPSSGFPLVIMTSGATEQEALEQNDTLFIRLEELKTSGEIQAFFSIHPFMFSKALQSRNQAIFLAQPDFPEALIQAFTKVGFKASAFTGMTADLKNTPQLGMLQDAPESIQSLLNNFVLCSGETWHCVNLVNPTRSDSLLKSAFPGMSDLIHFRKTDLINTAVTSSQREMAVLIGVGLLFIAIILFLYERRFIRVITTTMPAIGATLITLAIIQVTTGAINMLHVLSLLLILCMGVDYGIFMTDALKPNKEQSSLQAAGASVILSSLTTLFGFGVLSFASNPALRSIGVTVGIGGSMVNPMNQRILDSIMVPASVTNCSILWI